MKKLFVTLVSILLISIPLTNNESTSSPEDACDINFHALYILGIHIGSLEYAAYEDYRVSHTNTIIDYGIQAADATNCISSVALRNLKSEMANSQRSANFTGRIREIREQYGREIENNCICIDCNSVVNPNDHTNWFWPVEQGHVWYGNNIYQINDMGYKTEIFQGSMVWGWIYYLKDPQGRWLRVDGGNVYYVNWDIFKTMYTYVSREEFPNDPKNSHKDIWRKNDDGTNFELTYVESVTDWETPVSNSHPWYGKTAEALTNSGYKPILYHGSAVWGWNNYFKDGQGNWYRVTGNQVFSVNWNNFKMLYTYVRTDQLNTARVSHQDVWKHNKTGHELILVYVK